MESAKKYWKEGRTIEAVKAVKRGTGMSLGKSKAYCENIFNNK